MSRLRLPTRPASAASLVTERPINDERNAQGPRGRGGFIPLGLYRASGAGPERRSDGESRRAAREGRECDTCSVAPAAGHERFFVARRKPAGSAGLQLENDVLWFCRVRRFSRYDAELR